MQKGPTMPSGAQKKRIEELFAFSRSISLATAMYILIEKIDKRFGFYIILDEHEEALSVLNEDVVMSIVMSPLSARRASDVIAEKTIEATVKLTMTKMKVWKPTWCMSLRS